MRRKQLFSAVLLLAAFAGRGQAPPHAVGMGLDTVLQTGFYQIILPSEFVARCRADLSDLRVYRLNEGFVPYVLKTDKDVSGTVPVPDPKISQKDSSNKHSYISLQYPDTYRIDQLGLVIRNPVLFKRTARIINPDDSTGRPWVAFITIDPRDTIFHIPTVKARRLLIDISNADNAPLVISRVSSYQSAIYILTHLEKGGAYELEGGDPMAEKPDYDLHYFTDSMRQKPLFIDLKPVYFSRIKEEPVTRRKEAASGNTRSRVLLWSVIVLVLLLLIYISVKMVKAIAKKDIDDRL